MLKRNRVTKYVGGVIVVACVGIGSYYAGKDVAKEHYQPIINTVANAHAEATEEVESQRQLIFELNNTLQSMQGEIETIKSKLDHPIIVESSASNEYDNTGSFTISAYSPYDDKNGINSYGDPSETSTGTTPRPGTFAVDPDVIPYGSNVTIMYPNGTVERGVAEDTGGAIKNNRIDVFRYTYDGALDFGMKDALVLWTDGSVEK